MHTQTMHMYVYHKMYTCNERYFLMFLECNNHEAHGPTNYRAYATISNRQKQLLWTYVMYVLTSATDSFNIHTSLVWLDPSLSLHMHVNGNQPSACMRSYSTWSVILSVCLSVCYHVFCHYVQQGGQKAVPTGSVPHWLDF